MFSQGCALGGSLLLLQEWERQKNNTGQKSPFAAGIFICGGPPLQILSEEVGYALPESIFTADSLSRSKLAEAANADNLLALGSQRWNNISPGGGSAEEEERIRAELASYGNIKIQIPTVHVYGDKDPRYEASVQLSGLCEGGKRRTFNHGGGHEIPRFESVTATVTEMVIWALREGGVLD